MYFTRLCSRTDPKSKKKNLTLRIIYIYIYMCVCVCCMFYLSLEKSNVKEIKTLNLGIFRNSTYIGWALISVISLLQSSPL